MSDINKIKNDDTSRVALPSVPSLNANESLQTKAKKESEISQNFNRKEDVYRSNMSTPVLSPDIGRVNKTAHRTDSDRDKAIRHEIDARKLAPAQSEQIYRYLNQPASVVLDDRLAKIADEIKVKIEKTSREGEGAPLKVLPLSVQAKERVKAEYQVALKQNMEAYIQAANPSLKKEIAVALMETVSAKRQPTDEIYSHFNAVTRATIEEVSQRYQLPPTWFPRTEKSEDWTPLSVKQAESANASERFVNALTNNLINYIDNSVIALKSTVQNLKVDDLKMNSLSALVVLLLEMQAFMRRSQMNEAKVQGASVKEKAEMIELRQREYDALQGKIEDMKATQAQWKTVGEVLKWASVGLGVVATGISILAIPATGGWSAAAVPVILGAAMLAVSLIDSSFDKDFSFGLNKNAVVGSGKTEISLKNLFIVIIEGLEGVFGETDLARKLKEMDTSGGLLSGLIGLVNEGFDEVFESLGLGLPDWVRDSIKVGLVGVAAIVILATTFGFGAKIASKFVGEAGRVAAATAIKQTGAMLAVTLLSATNVIPKLVGTAVLEASKGDEKAKETAELIAIILQMIVLFGTSLVGAKLAGAGPEKLGLTGLKESGKQILSSLKGVQEGLKKSLAVISDAINRFLESSNKAGLTGKALKTAVVGLIKFVGENPVKSLELLTKATEKGTDVIADIARIQVHLELAKQLEAKGEHEAAEIVTRELIKIIGHLLTQLGASIEDQQEAASEIGQMVNQSLSQISRTTTRMYEATI